MWLPVSRTGPFQHFELLWNVIYSHKNDTCPSDWVFATGNFCRLGHSINFFNYSWFTMVGRGWWPGRRKIQSFSYADMLFKSHSDNNQAVNRPAENGVKWRGDVLLSDSEWQFFFFLLKKAFPLYPLPILNITQFKLHKVKKGHVSKLRADWIFNKTIWLKFGLTLFFLSLTPLEHKIPVLQDNINPAIRIGSKFICRKTELGEHVKHSIFVK